MTTVSCSRGAPSLLWSPSERSSEGQAFWALQDGPAPCCGERRWVPPPSPGPRGKRYPGLCVGPQGPESSPGGVGESPHLVLCREAGHGGGPGLAFHGEVVLAVRVAISAHLSQLYRLWGIRARPAEFLARPLGPRGGLVGVRLQLWGPHPSPLGCLGLGAGRRRGGDRGTWELGWLLGMSVGGPRSGLHVPVFWNISWARWVTQDGLSLMLLS